MIIYKERVPERSRIDSARWASGRRGGGALNRTDRVPASVVLIAKLCARECASSCISYVHPETLPYDSVPRTAESFLAHRKINPLRLRVRSK